MTDKLKCHCCKQFVNTVVICSLCKEWSCRGCTEKEPVPTGHIQECRDCRSERRNMIYTMPNADRCKTCGWPERIHGCFEDKCGLNPIIHKDPTE